MTVVAKSLHIHTKKQHKKLDNPKPTDNIHNKTK